MAVGRFNEIVVDCTDPRRLAEFWQALVGGNIDQRTATNNWCMLVDCVGLRQLGFQRVPEPKSTKNRVHLDVDVDDLVVSTERAVALGAVKVGGIVSEPPGGFQVMLDLEGNEFCLVTDNPVAAN
jgi:predicted enzyme related to lactoylglutathione lyase